MIYNYTKLIGRITEKFGSQKAFAAAIRSTESAVSLKLNNRRKFTQEDIESWRSALDIAETETYSYFFAR